VTADALPKVYLYAAGRYDGGGGDLLVVAVTEDGRGLAHHVCSSMDHARHDLHDIGPARPAYEQCFGGWGAGQFYDLVTLPEGEAPPKPVMDAIRARNAEYESVVDGLLGAQSDPRVLVMFTIFERPDDHPDGWVVRRFDCAPAGVRRGPLIGFAASLEDARKLVPGHADTRLPRSDADDPKIVESWV
jgi:hypothetical protein